MKLKFRGRTKQRKKNRWCKFYTSQPPACTQLNNDAMRHSPSWALRCNNSAERLLLALPGHCRTEEGIKTWCESACLLSIFLQINISSVLLCNTWPTVTNYLIKKLFWAIGVVTSDTEADSPIIYERIDPFYTAHLWGAVNWDWLLF